MKFESQRVPAAERSEFMRLARQRYDFALHLDQDDRQLAEEDAIFAAALPLSGGGTTQWDEKVARDRIAASRPVITENRLHTFTAQVVNDGRQSKPAIKIAAMDNGTKENAEYIQGRMRQIEYDCDADTAYDTAREQQTTSGRAFLRIRWEYEPKSFRKRPVIEAIPNQFSVVYGPSQRYDRTDAEYCFVISHITREDHARKYGEDTTAARTDFASNANPAIGWLGCGPNGELIQEAEYWLKEYVPRTLCELSNGRTYWKDEIPPELNAIDISVAQQRQEMDVRVVQYIIDGADILDENEDLYTGPFIPIIPQWGREQFVNDTWKTTSLIRYAKEPQRRLNLFVSNFAEQVAQLPKTPWLIPVGGIPAGHEDQWAKVNREPLAWLYYNTVDPQTGAAGLPRPERVTNEPPIMALVTGYQQCVDAIKASMGIFDASLGNQGNETSGRAIDSRKRESDNANFHFHGNEARTRKHIGRVLLEMLKEIDQGKGQRAVRSEDGKTTIVRIGEPYQDKESGKQVHYDIGSGDYGVAVSTGPSYNSQRAEAFDTYWEMAKTNPEFFNIAADKILRASDFPGSDEIADRYEKLLPPQLQPQKGGEQNQIPPQVLQKFQQIQQAAGDTIEKLTERVHELEDDLHAQRVQAESRERIVAMQEETKRLDKLVDVDHREGVNLLQRELEAIRHRLDLKQAEADREHDADQAERDRQHQAEQAEATRQAQAQQPDAAGPEPAAAPPATPQKPANAPDAQPAAEESPAGPEQLSLPTSE